MLQKNEIVRIYGKDYKQNTIRLLEEADLATLIGSTDRGVDIKPNLVSPAPPVCGGTTHTEVVAGILEYLQGHGFKNIRIMEGSWVGDKTTECFDVCGYYGLAQTYNVPLLDCQKEKGVQKNCGGMNLSICACVNPENFLINVPVLKGHGQTRITCALKNMKGLIPNSEKRRFHALGLHKPIAHLSAGIRQDFIVTDHICGDLDYEDGGNPTVTDCVMVSRDPVLTDAYVCRLLGYELPDVPYIGMAEALGSGSADLSTASIRTIGENNGVERSASRKLVEVESMVDQVESCSACYAMLVPALERLKDEGLLENLNEHICIGQGWRGKTGKLGVGACTAAFETSIKGCPPDSEDIYRELKAYLEAKK